MMIWYILCASIRAFDGVAAQVVCMTASALDCHVCTVHASIPWRLWQPFWKLDPADLVPCRLDDMLACLAANSFIGFSVVWHIMCRDQTYDFISHSMMNQCTDQKTELRPSCSLAVLQSDLLKFVIRLPQTAQINSCRLEHKQLTSPVGSRSAVTEFMP